MRIDSRSVADYIAAQPKEVRPALKALRAAVRKAVPKAQESISYGMPAYRLPDGPVMYFAGWKEHCSIYPASGRILAAFQSELAPYEVSKGTLRLPLDQPIPVRLIGRIAKARAKEIALRAEAKRAARKKRSAQ